MWFLNLLPPGVRRAVFPVMLGLSALCLSPAVLAQAVNVTGVASGAPISVPLGGVETLGWSGLIGFLVFMLDRKDKSNADSQKAFSAALEAKDRAIQEMSMAHSARIEKFLEEAQDTRTGEADRFHTIFDKILTLAFPNSNGAPKTHG